MSFLHRQILGWGLLTLIALLGGAWLSRLDYAQKISTDVLDLIPADERSPELTLVRSLLSQAEARTMLFELTAGPGLPASKVAAQHFVAELSRSSSFHEVVLMGDTVARDRMGTELFERRFTLLFPLWLQTRAQAYARTGRGPSGYSEWLAHDTVGVLTRFLASPEALAFEGLVPADPLLLMPGAVDSLSVGLSRVQAPPAGLLSPTLVWAQLAASPLSEEAQEPAFAAIEQSKALVRAVSPGFAVAYTGLNCFAAASRLRIELEVLGLNLLSLVAVLSVAFTLIRRVHRGLHLLPVLALSVLGAWVAVTLMFDRLHIMVFVVGSMLTGVAIDYGFYLFMQAPLYPEEDYWAKVRRLAKPLLASCLTTVAGFALLVFSELPLIRQLGVFVAAGLVSALLAAVLYFSTVANPFLEARTFCVNTKNSAKLRSRFRTFLFCLWLAALPGIAFLTWKDDIRELEVPSEALKAENVRITGLFGGQADSTVYLSYGNTAVEARDSVEKLETWLANSGAAVGPSLGLGKIVPTERVHTSSLAFSREYPLFPQQLSTALSAEGYDAAAFAPFFEAYARHFSAAKQSDLEASLTALQGKLTGPLGFLLHIGRPYSWFITLTEKRIELTPPAETRSVSTSQLQALNQIFARYRQAALGLSLAGLALVGAGVLLSYGWRDGARIFAIPCGACLGVFGLFGWLGQPLNLFHLLGAFLGVCLTHNYSIFSATSAYRSEPPPVSVRLSGLTTAASFGVLALSGIPVVRALGLTVALMVVFALLVIEFEQLQALRKHT